MQSNHPPLFFSCAELHTICYRRQEMPTSVPTTRPSRVLLADPNPSSQSEVRAALPKGEWTLECTGTGEGALEALRKSPADACLVDLGLEDLPGLDLLRILRAEFPRMPVIALSRDSSIQESVAAMRLGAVDYLPQPVESWRLSVCLRNAVQGMRQKAENEQLRSETHADLSRIPIDTILQDLAASGGSDLHLKVGRPPLMRIAGHVLPSRYPVIETSDMEQILRKTLGAEAFENLLRDFEADVAYVLPNVARFRVNASKRMGEFGAAFRVIPIQVPTIDQMGLPTIFKDIAKVPQGMILVTGPTGSGKSTTLATMVEHLNLTEDLHIVTIEDPVEFVYTDKKCVINQRQLGADIKSLDEALRRVLRQDPDVILMGEMRDRASMEFAMHASETGHLVLSTLHTNDAKQTIERIVDTFPRDAERQVRSMLSLTLYAVICQRLIPKADGTGSIAAVEIMINSPQIRELINEGKTSQIERAMASSGDYYRMQTFNQALAKLAMEGLITQDAALSSSTNPGDLRLLLRGVGSSAASAAREQEPTRPAPPPLQPPSPPSTPAPAQHQVPVSESDTARRLRSGRSSF